MMLRGNTLVLLATVGHAIELPSFSDMLSGFRLNNMFTILMFPKNPLDFIDAEPESLPASNLEDYLKFAHQTQDGSGSSLVNPKSGKSHEPLWRKSTPPASYTGKKGELPMRGPLNPAARTISNVICAESGVAPENDRQMTDFVWAWGQFVDHDMDLTEGASPADIIVIDDFGPQDPFFGETINFVRSNSRYPETAGPWRAHINSITSYIDASQVYGADEERSLYLRSLDGSGKLKTSSAQNGEVLPPRNTEQRENEFSAMDPSLFLVGDVRGNEQVLLTALHTLFLREHNRLADLIVERNPGLEGQGEAIFQLARQRVAGLVQSITMYEFLPALLGKHGTAVGEEKTPLDEFGNAAEQVQATITNEFSSAGFRIGHTMVSNELQLGPTPGTNLQLEQAFFNPNFLFNNGIEKLLEGAAVHLAREVDGGVVNALRNTLFRAPLDLPLLNIMRGRDHGLPGYNSMRESFGLAKHTQISQLTSVVDLQDRLRALYDPASGAGEDDSAWLDFIDPWVAGIVEDHIEDASIGETFATIIIDQFKRCKDGDRFWFDRANFLTPEEQRAIRHTTLADVIRRNSLSAITVPDNCFLRDA